MAAMAQGFGLGLAWLGGVAGGGGSLPPSTPDRALTYIGQPLTFGGAYLTYTPS